jgi:putative ABC transport system permease protein
MSLFRNFRIAFDALMANKLRSGLTMLGIIIGVGSVVALLSVGNGAQASIARQINSIGTNLLTVVPGQVRLTGNVGPASLRAGGATKPLTLSDARAIARDVPLLSAVAPEITINNQTIAYNKNKIATTVRGVTADYAFVRSLNVESGRWIEAADDSSAERVAVLGPDAADNLFEGADPIGQRIKIGGTTFTVIGVTVPTGASFAGNNDTSIFVPIQAAYRTLTNARTANGDRRVSLIYLSALTDSDIPAAEAAVIDVMRRQHQIGAEDSDDFTVLTQQQFLSIAGNITGILTLFLGAIAGISLLVGGIGIMNIMLVSVTERTKEIGLRKAVGAKRRVILIQFLVETITLSLLGGFIGIAIGIGISALVSATGVIAAVITPESIVLAVSFSLAVGLFFGIYPASRAAALQPIEALRYE